MEKLDNVCVRFTGKNYTAWAFQLEIFLKGKELWGHIDDSNKGDLAVEGSVVAKAAWAAKDAQIMSWILSSMEPHLILSLRPHRSAKAMWDHLTQVYNQDNNARRFQLELAIANYTQGDLSIQDYYSGFLTLWNDYSDLVTAKISAEGVLAVQQVHKISQRDQFLMKLRSEYEPVRASLVNRDPVPSLDACFGELLREEQRLHTQTIMEQTRAAPVAYAAYRKGKDHDMSKTQCYSCKKHGHIAPHCPNKFCNYCKQPGHIIKECSVRPPRSNKAYHTAVTNAGPSAPQPLVGPPISQPPAHLLTREMVQEMIVSAFSTLGLQGTGSSTLPWILDSGASNHMTNSFGGLSNIRKYCGSSHIQTANGNALPIVAVGDIPPLKDIFVSPKLAVNLASVGQFVDNNCDVSFSKHGCIVQDQMSGQLVAKGPKHGRLFFIQFHVPRTLVPSSVLSLFCTAPKVSNEVWHKRLGHPNPRILSHLLKSGLINTTMHSSSSMFLDCVTCKLGKSKVLPFPSEGSRATNLFEIVHSDVWGISPILSHAGYKYFVTFIDDYSRYTWVYFLRNKSEVFSMFKLFLVLVNTQFSATVKTLRSDSGGEYMSNDFQSFLQSNGIISQRSCSYTPQQNGVAERKNRHLLDVVRTLLIENSVPPKFWVEALITATYLINRLPSQVLGLESPYFRLHHCPPIYTNLHTFGCVCFMHLPPPHRNKLSAQSIRCAFLGYSITQKGYLCFDPHTNRVHVSRNVIFFENQCFFPLPSSSATSLAFLPSFDDSSHLPSAQVDRFKPYMVYKRRLPVLPPSASVLSSAPPLHPPVASEVTVLAPLRRSSRVSVPPAKYGFNSSVAHNSTAALSATLSSIAIPTGYSQAAKEPCWQQAMQEELHALEANQTWDIVDCPSGVTPLGCRWVYSVKIKADGSLDRYKARLVALGNHQKYGVHYEETFAPVAKMGTIRTILAIAASKHWCLHQLDVKNAFLHGDLTEDIYMRPPAGLFSTPTSAVCKLRRSLYGLKQAPRAWYERFTSILLQFDFLKSKYDASLFLRKTAHGVVFLLVYVDDIVITGTDLALIDQLKQHLQKSFHMKDLGPLTYFLGLEIHAGSHGIFLSQHKYAMDLVTAAGLQNSPPLDTPMEINLKLSKDEGDLLSDPAAYRTLVGSLIYLTNTRPDISYAVQQVSQFMASPRHLHLAAVKRIIRYVHGTIRRGLCYPAGTSLDLIAYSDADYAGCSDTRRSTTGWCMFLGPALISWKSKKQDRVSKSSTESEYRAMSQACSEIIWLHGLLAELGFQQCTPTPLFADNTSAIHITANPIFHERTKHIEVDCHFIRDAFAAQTISLPHVSSNLQENDWAGLLHLVKFYKSRRFDAAIGLPKPNDFHDFPEYFVLEAIPHAVAKVRAADKKSPREAVEFILQLLKYNDNTGNPYSDVFWLAALVQSVGELEFGQQTVLFLSSLLKRIDCLLQFDRLMLSYNGILTISCIRTLTQIALKLSGSIHHDHVFELIKPFRDFKTIWQIRIEASRALLDLEFHCKGMDAALSLFITYLEEEPSLRGQAKLGAHAMRLCQIQDESDSEDAIKCTTLLALIRLLEGHIGFNNTILRHHLFCILQILAGRAPTLYGIPRDRTLCIGDSETCSDPRNIFAGLVTETKPLEPPMEIPKLAQDNFAFPEAIKKVDIISNKDQHKMDMAIPEVLNDPDTISNNHGQKMDLAIQEASEEVAVPEASKETDIPVASKEEDNISNSHERRRPVVKIRVKHSAASSRAEETDIQNVERSQGGHRETDRGASSSVSVDAPQRISTEAVSISYQNLEEVNSCLDHGSRMSASIGSAKLASDGDNFGKELQCTAESSKVSMHPQPDDPSSPRVMQDNLVDTDAQRFASLQTLSVERVNPDGGSLGIMASSSRGKEKEKKDKEKKRKREDHKGHRDDPEYLERKLLKKEKKRKEKEMTKLLSGGAKATSVELLGKNEKPTIKLATVPLKPNQPSESKAVATNIETKPEPSEGTSSVPKFRIKIKNRTLNS